MKVLVVSDTHGMDEQLEEVLIRETPFDLLVHCGDVEGREEYIEVIAECPAYIIAGNNDYFSDLPMEICIQIGKYKAFVTHGHQYGVSWDYEKMVSAAVSRNCDLVFFGHIHRPVIERIDGVLCMNPGSLAYPRQVGHKPSYMVIEVDEDGEIHPEIRVI